MFLSARRLVSSRLGRRGGKESLNQIGKRTDFAVGRLSRPVGNRKAARESANERRPIADRYAHMFAEGGEFIDELLAFKRAPVDAILEPRSAVGPHPDERAARRRSRACARLPRGPSPREYMAPEPDRK